jgi:hypothetical protein
MKGFSVDAAAPSRVPGISTGRSRHASGAAGLSVALAVAANTSNSLVVTAATCTINATVNVTSSNPGATLSGGSSTAPTTLINNGTLEITGSGKTLTVEDWSASGSPVCAPAVRE